jgi:lysophospholipase L1-like esterase
VKKQSKPIIKKIFLPSALILVIGLAIAYLVIAYVSMTNYAFKEYPTVAFKPGAEFLLTRDASDRKPPFRYVVLGDSTSVGQGAKLQVENYSYQFAQTVLLKNHESVKISNLAVSGAKTADVLTQQIAEAIALNPDLIMLSIGANDVIGVIRAHEFRQNYKMILQQLQQTSANIVLLNIPAFSTSPLLWEPYRSLAHNRAAQFNQIITELGSNISNIKVVDIYKGTEPDFRLDPQRNFSQDNFHPSSAGYSVWARVITESIK